MSVKVKKMEVDDRDPDNIYVNLILQNNNNVYLPAEFATTLPSAIIKEPEKYYMSIIRFYIDGSSLPILLFPDSTTNPLWITLTIGGTDYSEQVVYSAVSGPEYPNPYFTYTLFAQDINTAFAAAFVAAGGGRVAADAPYIFFDPETGRFTLYAQSEFLETNTSRIYVNGLLSSYFDNFQLAEWFSENSPDYKDVRYIIKDFYGRNNETIAGKTWYSNTQETQALFRLADVAKIVFESNLLPIRPEYSSAPNTTTAIFNAGNAGNALPSSRTITDFVPSNASDHNLHRSELVYIPSGQYRLTDLQQLSTGINGLDIRITWLNKQGTSYKLYLVPLQNASVKLLFVKKSAYHTKN